MKVVLKYVLVLGVLAMVTSSCTIMSYTKGRMLRTPVDYRFKEFSDSLAGLEYRVAVDDQISLQMYANDGYSTTSLIGSSSAESSGGRGGGTFKVRSDSTIKVPILGKVKVVGLTMEEIEVLFESLLSAYFKSPFVIADIDNRRIYLFTGISGASVITLRNQNTTLFELLATAGGVSQGNASKIKIVRGDLKNPDIYKIDLSTIDGIQTANLTLQAGDIVYIDPIINWSQVITADFVNALGVINTAVLIYTVLQ